MHSVSVRGLSKCYRLGRKVAKNESGMARLKSLFGAFNPGKAGREIWALRDVSFDVEPGTVLGVIGLNGAGKTTLLKMIGRVSPPTEGRIEGRGRVIPLLAMGQGMRTDLTGRENLFLNAAMYGIPRADVMRRLDEIVAFAGLEEFMDVPMRHYSSGMAVRLAFSTAINMEPDILLADEVLAVGDMQFQEKCLQRVEEAGRQGMTVLFVSHDMAAIRRLCHRVVWLNGGKVVADGPPDEVVPRYEDSAWVMTRERGEKDEETKRAGQVMTMHAVNAHGEMLGMVRTSEEFFLRTTFRLLRRGLRYRCVASLFSQGVLAFRSIQPDILTAANEGIFSAIVRIPARLLAATTYSVKFGVFLWDDRTGEMLPAASVENLLSFQAVDVDSGDDGWLEAKAGVVAPRLDWDVHPEVGD